MTFSIVGRDGAAYGVAVASKFLAVGYAVPAARAGVGAVATQAYANLAYGPEGLDLLSGGATSARSASSRPQAGRRSPAAPATPGPVGGAATTTPCRATSSSGSRWSRP